MKQELEKEIMDSKILRSYVKIQKMAKYIPIFKWVAGISFVIGFIDTIINGEMSNFSGAILIAVWVPGLIFAFVAGFAHFLTGIKLRKLASKYRMDQEEVQTLSGKLLDK
jgi:phosphotransferase system  glucose/maltose/N-acetylglucosamine-specific IIC component